MRLRPPFVTVFACRLKTHSPLEIEAPGFQRLCARINVLVKFGVHPASKFEAGLRVSRYAPMASIGLSPRDSGSSPISRVFRFGVTPFCTACFVAECQLFTSPWIYWIALRLNSVPFRNPDTQTPPRRVGDYVFESISGEPKFPHNLPATLGSELVRNQVARSSVGSCAVANPPLTPGAENRELGPWGSDSQLTRGISTPRCSPFGEGRSLRDATLNVLA